MCKALYVDGVLATPDANRKYELDKFVRKVKKHFIIQVLGESLKFLGMEIAYLREQEFVAFPNKHALTS